MQDEATSLLDVSTEQYVPIKGGISAQEKLDELLLKASDNDSGKIKLGICAMDKKARSKPMAEILSRLDEENFCVVFFGDQVILNENVEDWPTCDALIAFFSKGYPLAKVKKYVELRKPLTLNDLSMQDIMKDRRRVYDLLADMGIDTPRHVFVNRDGYQSNRKRQHENEDEGEEADTTNEPAMIECDDHIEVHGVVINKPFVEKPVDAEGMYI